MWDDEEQSGPAVHAPDAIKNIAVKEYRIEWLNISEPETNFYVKNHMVATVVFVTTQIFDRVEYHSARLSMELDIEKKVVELAARPVRTTQISISI